MKNYLRIAATSLLTMGTLNGHADDVEIYFTEGVESAPYVLLISDMSSNAMSTLCNKLSQCSMTAEALTQLKSFRTNDPTGECPNNGNNTKVTRWEVYRAVLATVLSKRKDGGIWVPGDDVSELLFGDLVVALAASNHKSKSGGTILMEYTKLSEGGLVRLLEDLQQPPCTMGGNYTHVLGIMDIYLEWLSYLNGYAVRNGMDTGSNFQYAGWSAPISPDYDPNAIIGVSDNSMHSGNPGKDYKSPFDEDSCPALYSVIANMTGSTPGQDGSLTSTVGTAAVAAGGMNWQNSDFSKSYDMMEKMHEVDTDLLPTIAAVDLPLLKSWVISDLNGGVCDPNGNVASCGRSDVGEMAQGGGTAPLDVSNGVALEEELINIFGEILSVSSSFVSASVPVNVFNQTEALDNIYTALFEAQDTLNWPGNVKKLKLTDKSGDGVFDDIVDVNGDPGFETTGSNKGRIYYSALTFWSDPNELDAGAGSDPNESDFVPAGKDGRVVDRGGSGQQVPGFISNYPYFIGNSNGLSAGGKTSRTVYVEAETLVAPDGTTYVLGDDNLEPFNVADASDSGMQDALGVSTQAEAEDLIEWGRGMDPDAADPPNTPRGWIMGDAIHSRPFALNYGDTDGESGSDFDPNNPNVRLLFGSGNGSFHVVDNINAGGSESGREIFAYYPRETLSQIKLRKAGDKIDEGIDMRYGVDGEPVVLTNDVNNDQSLVAGDNDEAYVFFGMRRGGFSYHALDIIDPSAPKLQWKITHTRDDASSDFDELGLTFSTPRVTTVVYEDEKVDALVFAGGYYGGWDPNDPSASTQIGKDYPPVSTDSWGNAIYIVNARTGDLIWKVTGGSGTDTEEHFYHGDMLHSIPSDVTLLETDSGILHRIYVGDTAGNVWRADTPSGTCDGDETCTDQRENWFASRLGDLANSNDIRFFHAPDVVQAKDETTGTFFDGVLIQSGNRADPLNNRFTAVQNYLYYMRDYEVVSGASSVIKEDGGSEVAQYEATDIIDRTACIDPNNPEAGCNSLTNNFGWKIKLGSPGEKGLSTPLVDFGRVFSSTYVPGSAGVCGASPEGNGKLYLTNLKDGTAVGNQRSYELGPGIPPSPVIIGDAIWLPGGGVDADLDGDGDTDDLLTKSFTQRLIPIYWREPGIDDL